MLTNTKQRYLLKVIDGKIKLPNDVFLRGQFSKGDTLTVYKRRDDCIIFEEGLESVSGIETTINQDGTVEIPSAFTNSIKTKRVAYESYGVHSFKVLNHYDNDIELNTYKGSISYSNYGITIPKELTNEIPFLIPGSYVDINISGKDLIITKSSSTGSRGNTKCISKYRRLSIPKTITSNLGIYDSDLIGIQYNKDIVRLRPVNSKEVCFVTNSLTNTKEVIPGLYLSAEGAEILREALKNY